MDERRVASSTIGLPRCESVKSQKSAQVPFVPLCRACVAGRDREVRTTFSPWWCSVGLCNNADRVAGKNLFTTFERQHLWRGTADNQNFHTKLIPSDSNTMSNLGGSFGSLNSARKILEGTRAPGSTAELP